VKHTDELRDIRYEGLEWLQSIGQTVQRDNYELVYTAPLLPSDLKGDTAEQLFYRFNNEHPADYRHPSMSVSDIVAIKRDGKVTERTIHKTKQHRPPKHQRSGAAFVVFQFFLGLPGLGPARRSCEPPRIVQTAQKESLSRNIQF
ncbi:MAG TPA: YodL domain-containing protein, partial [Subdoligranulum variabile]|nr:YodL domain-containing protein [Subdoligranulum variabile]